MIVVTGAAGFIGSCIVARLNELGREDLILVDRLEGKNVADGVYDLKKINLSNKKYKEYFDKDDFIQQVRDDRVSNDITCVIHMGACSSTTLQDADYFEENNFEYSRVLAEWALKHNIRFIYASSAATYGDGAMGYKDDLETIRQCKPLNLYGLSKQKMDEWVVARGALDKVVGLKFFNVFGPNEYHKEDMRSVVAKAFKTVVEEGTMKLFKSYKPEYADGEQMRDFIYVKDAVNVVLFFVERPDVNGIFNVGTGLARSWNDLANAMFKAADKMPDIQYFEMPESLRERYQYFTQADMSKLKSVGYSDPFYSLEDAVMDYAGYLKTQSNW